jgi:hypothetical protein
MYNVYMPAIHNKVNETELTNAIVELLLEYRYLQSNFLYALLKARGKKFGARYCRSKLLRMERQGLVYRPEDQEYVRNSHCAFLIYGLDEKGKAYAKERNITPHPISRIYRRKPDEKAGELDNASAKTRNFWHAMGIVNKLASIEIGARKHGLTFIPEGKIRADYYEKFGKYADIELPFDTWYKNQAYTGTLKSDYMFGLQYPDGLTSYFVGEVEFGNPIDNQSLSRNGSSWLGKLLGYMDIVHKKAYKERLGVNNLWVLVDAENSTKSQHQKELTEQLFGKSKVFYFQTIPNQRETHKSPQPFPELLTTPAKRAGMEPSPIYDQERDSVTE